MAGSVPEGETKREGWREEGEGGREEDGGEGMPIKQCSFFRLFFVSFSTFFLFHFLLLRHRCT